MAEWKCVLVKFGLLYVVTTGTMKMLQLLVGNWDTHLMVIQNIYTRLFILQFFKGAIPLTSYFTDYDWSYGILDPNCTGLESNIWNCSHNEAIDSNTCTGYDDAGVICQSKIIAIRYFYKFYTLLGGTIQPVNCVTGDIRLIGGTTSNEGRLEVCVNRVWGTVCGVLWGPTDSRVACRQLGHQELGILTQPLIVVDDTNDVHLFRLSKWEWIIWSRKRTNSFWLHVL